MTAALPGLSRNSILSPSSSNGALIAARKNWALDFGTVIFFFSFFVTFTKLRNLKLRQSVPVCMSMFRGGQLVIVVFINGNSFPRKGTALGRTLCEECATQPCVCKQTYLLLVAACRQTFGSNTFLAVLTARITVTADVIAANFGCQDSNRSLLHFN
jgi:hypothetical protein